MKTVLLSRLLGGLSLVLGAMELALPKTLSSGLGLPGGPWLVRAYGVREIAAGLTVLANPAAVIGPASRIAGDALDIATLLPALSPSNRKQNAALLAFAMVLGVTALDVICAAELAAEASDKMGLVQRARVLGRTAA